MIVSLCCVFLRFRISRSALYKIKMLNQDLYRKILGDKDMSWIERRSDSIYDFRIWIDLSRELSRCDSLSNVIGADICKKFIFLKRMIIFSYVCSIFIGVSVVFIVFFLVSRLGEVQ